MRGVFYVWNFLLTCLKRLWISRSQLSFFKFERLSQHEDNQMAPTFVLPRRSMQANKYGIYLQWCKESTRKIEGIIKEDGILNKRQCARLFTLLDRTIHAIQEMVMVDETLEFGHVFEEMCGIVTKIKLLVEDCNDKNWCRAIVFQMENKEAFRELVLNLKCCYDASCEILSSRHLEDELDDIIHIQFNVATFSEVVSDREDLKRRLEQAHEDDTCDHELAKCLLERLRNLCQIEGGELDTSEYKYYFKEFDFIQSKLGKGSSGSVYKSDWKGLPCAVKVLLDIQEKYFWKEARILAGLSHPNVIKYICCGRDEESGERQKIANSYLVMERMQKTLTDMLEKDKPLTYLVALDIMYQIASGMYYLHDMHVAHRDLKPDNVLVATMINEVLPYNHTQPFNVKLIDFGISKIEVGSQLEMPRHFNYGTRDYMAPEIFGLSTLGVVNPFKADVWSFGMTCSEILSRKKPFSHIKICEDIYETIMRDDMPALPTNHEDLRILIKDCWAMEPLQRPTFSEICERLTIMKRGFLVGTHSNVIPQFGARMSIFQATRSKSSIDLNGHLKKVLIPF